MAWAELICMSGIPVPLRRISFRLHAIFLFNRYGDQRKHFIPMKRYIIMLICLPLILSGCKVVIFTASEPDAKIYINGELRGMGSSGEVKTSRRNSTRVLVKKEGFFDEELTYYYYGLRFKPLVKYINLTKDDSYEGSIQNQYANKDFELEIRKEISEEKAWIIISEIITGYWDILEKSDKPTYMLTGWQTKAFSKIVVRTRVIVKRSGSNPLKYKVKIQSEYAPSNLSGHQQDEDFKSWDRILKEYDLLLSEFQTRLGNN